MKKEKILHGIDVKMGSVKSDFQLKLSIFSYCTGIWREVITANPELTKASRLM